MMNMLKLGVHFGHKKAKKHPKMDEYIFTIRNGINILDLSKTITKLEEATKYVKEIAANNGVIIFVGTKRQAKKVVKEAAEKCGMPYVTERWLGGTFTNFEKIVTSIKRLETMIEQKESGELEKRYNKKKRLEIKEDETALIESRSKNIPTIAIVDTNVDPSLINRPIPANDDAVGSIRIIVNAISDAIIEAKKQ